MILYSLICDHGHEFEGWFSSSAAFEDQARAKDLVCSICGSQGVSKAVMAPAISGTKRTTLTGEDQKTLRQYFTGIRKYVEKNADYVGTEFPEEARKIHYGETDERHIYGEATPAQVQDLVEEGIDVAPLPPDLDGTN